jgi:hypothetical protein
VPAALGLRASAPRRSRSSSVAAHGGRTGKRDSIRASRGFISPVDIATIRLRWSEPARPSPPAALTLSIRTPGARANLEGFTFRAADTTLSLSPMPRAASDPGVPPSVRDSLLRSAGGEFFRFEIRDPTVLVHFQPAARQRLGDWTTVSWVDWYRR